MTLSVDISPLQHVSSSLGIPADRLRHWGESVGEDASFFDADGDGCIDATWNMRHIEYWDLADLPLTYVIHQNGAPNVTDGSDFAAVQDGFAVWSTVATDQATTSTTTPLSSRFATSSRVVGSPPTGS